MRNKDPVYAKYKEDCVTVDCRTGILTYRSVSSHAMSRSRRGVNVGTRLSFPPKAAEASGPRLNGSLSKVRACLTLSFGNGRSSESGADPCPTGYLSPPY